MHSTEPTRLAVTRIGVHLLVSAAEILKMPKGGLTLRQSVTPPPSKRRCRRSARRRCNSCRRSTVGRFGKPARTARRSCLPSKPICVNPQAAGVEDAGRNLWKVPDGGEDCPDSLLPQQATVPFESDPARMRAGKATAGVDTGTS